MRDIDPFFVQALRLIAFDSYQRLAPQPYDPNLPVRVVDIDPEWIEGFGQWPWPRTIMRDLVLRLTERNAAAVTFDILFAEADRTSLEEVIKRLPPNRKPPPCKARPRSPTNDELFARRLGEGGRRWLPSSCNRPRVPRRSLEAGFAFAGDDRNSFAGTSPAPTSNLLFWSRGKGHRLDDLFPIATKSCARCASSSGAVGGWYRTFARGRGFAGGAGCFHLYSKIIERERRDSIWAEDRIEQRTHRRY